MKILGMRWGVRDNLLSCVKVNIDTNMEKGTKREILSQSSKIFDPLATLGPVTVKAFKIIILWKRNLGWDECIPIELALADQWSNLAVELSEASEISVSRL